MNKDGKESLCFFFFCYHRYHYYCNVGFFLYTGSDEGCFLFIILHLP